MKKKPNHLKRGDAIGIIAPSRSASIIKRNFFQQGIERLEGLGLKVIYGRNIFKQTKYTAGSPKDRANDIHDLFTDKSVKAIISAVGGYTCNHILPFLNFKLIKKNPKILIGYSDITALINAVSERCNFITFLGPNFKTLCQAQEPISYTIDYFKKTLFYGEKINVKPSEQFAEDKWMKVEKRSLIKNYGWRIINEGEAKGEIVGGNISTLQLLIGTKYCPSFDNKILFIEEDPEFKHYMVDRMLTHLRQTGLFDRVKGVVVGRFKSNTLFKKFKQIKGLMNRVFKGLDIPIIYGVDFGHSDPLLTIPIGGMCKINTKEPSIIFEKSVN